MFFSIFTKNKLSLKYFFFLLTFFISSLNFSQEKYPINYFRSPLDIPIVLSGTFGELRNNHFHSGLDIKTQGKEGLKIYAAADGFVSRIKISQYGFGKAIYITHPNGFSDAMILEKFQSELKNQSTDNVSYWPWFLNGATTVDGEPMFVGVCGLRNVSKNNTITGYCLEVGVHLLPEYWNQGYANEMLSAVLDWAFDARGCKSIFAGHHPENIATASLLKMKTKLGFKLCHSTALKELTVAVNGWLFTSKVISSPNFMPSSSATSTSTDTVFSPVHSPATTSL